MLNLDTLAASRTVSDGTSAIRHDAYDLEAWGQAQAEAPALTGQVERAREALPTGEALLRDIFFACHRRTALLAPNVALRPSHAINASILDTLLASPSYKALKTDTAGDVLYASMATIALGRAALRALPRAVTAQVAAAVEAEDAAAALTAAAETLEDAFEAASLAAEAAGDGLAPSTELGRAEALDAQAEAAAEARAAAEEAQAAAAALAGSALDDDAGLQVAAAVRGAATAAAAQIQETATVLAAFRGPGAGAGANTGRAGVAERFELARRILGNPKLRLLAQLVGRMERLAEVMQDTKVEQEPDELTGLALGRDLGLVVSSEYMALGSPATEPLFWAKWVDARLTQYELTDNHVKQKGKMIVVKDESGSMAETLGGMPYDKNAWATAVALALATVARKQHRDFLYLAFAHAGNLLVQEFPQGQHTTAQALALGEHFFDGGTDYRGWMSSVSAALATDAYRDADVVVISDGEATLSEPEVAAWQETLTRVGARSFGVLLSTNPRDGATLGRVCSTLLRVDDLAKDSGVLGTLLAL